jgi:DNA-binding transcriptional LysR family regulator
VTVLQGAMPQTALYVEADYSAQMCADVASGASELAILYTPKPHPDLHFETLGEIAYVMVSTEADKIEDVRAETYILAISRPLSPPPMPLSCRRSRLVLFPAGRMRWSVAF